ncbi:hypothetical protein CK203_034286 [Vitis vinifera]|uniref:Retrotransposon gag domain-containing protein n=1 Tax=Vitis vinifera TaxID=29760 RepID=A0A438INS7_VITVI|nr:hypothetical protein CK203_034286 [Vitis vinifera]
MDVPLEDQNSQHDQEDNFNAYRSMRDHMHPPHMSAPSCIVPSTEQLVIRPSHCATPTYFPWMESENPYSHIKEFESELFLRCYVFFNEATPRNYVWRRLHESESRGSMDFLNYVVEVSRGWDELNAREVGRMKSQPNAKGGMHVLNEDIDMKAKVAAMARKLEKLEMKKVQEVQAIYETPLQAMPCSICQSYEHLVEECLTIPTMREMFGDQANAIAPQQASNLKQAIVNLSKVVGDFVGDQKSINAQLNKRIDSVESIHEVEGQKGESSKVREVKAVITLRSVQVSSKVQRSGCPTISVSIGGTCVEKALFDLGASVNLLPYSIYKQLGLGELKPTSTTLSLADRSVKIPRGMIEDVLVQVDKFYYPVDFVVLDTDPVVK